MPRQIIGGEAKTLFKLHKNPPGVSGDEVVYLPAEQVVALLGSTGGTPTAAFRLSSGSSYYAWKSLDDTLADLAADGWTVITSTYGA